jgi:hypothetical protein
MEVKEIPIVELKYRWARLSKRGVSAKDIQKQRDAVKRRTFHSSTWCGLCDRWFSYVACISPSRSNSTTFGSTPKDRSPFVELHGTSAQPNDQVHRGRREPQLEADMLATPAPVQPLVGSHRCLRDLPCHDQ